jgi:hypothetical protein
MERQTVYFFEKPGEENTKAVLSCLVERMREGDIDSVAVASISGKMASMVAEELRKRGLETKVVCVSGPKSWQKYPQYRFPLITRKERARLEGMRVDIVDSIDEPFRPIEFRDWWEQKTLKVPHPESDLFWMTLICVGGHGFRTAIEVVFMAVEAGAIQPGERVLSVAGTGSGLDSAVVLMASRFDEAVGRDPAKRLKVEEILAMPKKTTWTGYG